MLSKFRKITPYRLALRGRPLLILALALIGLGVMAVALPARAITNCPCHIFSDATVPSSPIVVNGDGPSELGVRFKPRADGYITGVRFYKNANMTDAHVGNLWSPSGTLLASGSFTSETASGWQDLSFATPVHVAANTVYTASFFTAAGNYIANHTFFTTDVDNYPLLAPSTANINAAGYSGNGVFTQGSGDVYPTSAFQDSNYWVDVDYRQTIDGSAPQVTSTSPANGATGAFTASNLTVSFNQNLNPSTIDTSTAQLTDAHGNVVAAAVSYDDSAKSITLNPAAQLSQNVTYKVSLRGGIGGISNLDGTTLANDYQWTFTTGNDTCPCSIWNEAAPTGEPQIIIGSGGEEYGETVHADENGYLHAVRFYKSLEGTAVTHTVHVWATDGTLLASGTSSHESSYGWQEVPLTTAVHVTQGQKYIISFYATDTTLVYTLNSLASQAGSGVLHADASGSVFKAGSGDVFPSTVTPGDSKTSFWIDGVFATQNTYKAPFDVAVSQPLNGAYGVQVDKPVTIKMSNAVDSATVSGAVTVKNAFGQTVPGTVSYDDTEHTISFTPTGSLAANSAYMVSVAASLKDIYGTAIAPYVLRFTTGTALSGSLNQGLGGPVLVVTSSAHPYDTYLAEILRTQGINYFTVKDVAQLSASTLADYRMVLLGQSGLSAAQVSTLSTWVQSGGNLIAMRPDKQLSPLLGLTDQSQTLSDGYIKVDTTQAPGTGVTAETMQYHTAADLYAPLSGTRAVASLYSDAVTPRGIPAVTERAFGSGHAAAFLYDLPQSIALTHQGNPAWAGQERDGVSPIRPNDMFDGISGTDWLNTNKAFIPQADEQQRLLVNMMVTMDQTRTPLPQFWILPHGLKSALVMTLDDHSTSSSSFDIINALLNRSATNCSVYDWTCQRSGSLLYTASGLTSAQADASAALGFVLGVHVQTGCNNYAGYSALSTAYTSQIAAFRAKYTNLPPQRFDRTHCYVWSDWDSVPKVDAANGMRINYNYEWFPSSWAGANTGYLTGSGLAMRFTDSGGNLLDAYQGVTDLDYENDPTSATMNTDLDNTINSNEFYGVLGTHYDTSGTSYYQQLIDAAASRNIPMISADQWATWKDGLNSSTFSHISSAAAQLSFAVSVAQGGEGMQVMIPASSGNGALTGLKQGSANVSYVTSTIKGVQYAVFDAAPGTYVAQYGTSAATGGSGGRKSNIPSGTASASHASATPAAASITSASPFRQPSEWKNAVPSHSSPGSQAFPAWKVIGYAASLIGLLLLVFWGVTVTRRRA